MTRKDLIKMLQEKRGRINFVYRLIGDIWRNSDGSPVEGAVPAGFKTFTFQDTDDLEAVKELLNNNLN